jgi:hypothetical protein
VIKKSSLRASQARRTSREKKKKTMRRRMRISRRTAKS